MKQLNTTNIILLGIIIFISVFFYNQIEKLQTELRITESNYSVSQKGMENIENKYDLVVTEKGMIQVELDKSLLDNIIVKESNDDLNQKNVSLSQSLKNSNIEVTNLLTYIDEIDNGDIVADIDYDGNVTYLDKYLKFRGQLNEDFTKLHIDTLLVFNKTTIVMGLKKGGTFFNRTYVPTARVINSNPKLTTKELEYYGEPQKPSWLDRNTKWIAGGVGLAIGILIAK